ncbi:Mrp/NBP35 family ATP-binding protein [Moraxella sp. Tifton1]|uniref:Mrp/NBP35 family ATP-binding protein n=1 Tax=Moraxella oculi TaxID=2940516 RepID=UPI002010D8E7|nr:Mrp/NBP35 family ATP-binding protein [Moraxella sp. Tifton1]MCL1623960.1 Mrp/NBP35 family ATP-binding protein [Moraxella sp. Tifton1]
MFNPFKKKRQIGMVDIDQVLGEFFLYGMPLSVFIDGKDSHDDVLNLSLKIPKEADQSQVEQLYQHLREKLHLIGVAELNLNVILSDQPTSVKSIHDGQSFDQMNQSAISTNAKKKQPIKSPPRQDDIAPHPRIRHIIAVASGKGGVGKSTVTVNIALALQRLGKTVGILDADIYGPSIPDMLGVAGTKPDVENEQFVPIDAQGIAMLSIGSLIDDEGTPIVWRGVKATGAFMQLYNQTNWPNLDYLIIDMPPGTGDIQLTLAQRIPVTCAIVVTTPQHIALLDAKKGVAMFQKVGIPLLGIIENMALHVCANCGHVDHIFGTDGGAEMVRLYGVPLLGQLPINAQMRQQMDFGTPKNINTDILCIYDDIAKNIERDVKQHAKTRNDGRIF